MINVDIFVDGAPAPFYATTGAAGMDLTYNGTEPLFISGGGGRALVSTGIRLAIPEGYEAQVRPRSGLALKHGVTVLNTPGTIDSDYRGEVGVILINHSHEVFKVEPGMRIAQMVFAKVERVTFNQVNSPDDLGQSERGAGGFGSTGV